MDKPHTSTDTPQPVAYDAQGRPLYLHPPQSSDSAYASPQVVRSSHVTVQPDAVDGHNYDPRIRAQYANEPEVVHATRPYEPQPFTVSDELRQKHEDSVQRYPFLNLSEGEYVILDIKRHPIGLLMPILITVMLSIFTMIFAVIYPDIMPPSSLIALPSASAVLGIALLLVLLIVVGGAMSLWVYLQNQFFMTNESVIQEIQNGLFARHEQTVSLGSIEDASFRKDGILQTLLDYGTIRLSTEGEETTYVFHYVANPKRQVAILNNAIEAFKNGRPVED